MSTVRRLSPFGLAVSAAFVLQATVSYGAPINVISDPSFEVDDGPWVRSNAILSAPGRTGSYFGEMGGSGSLFQNLPAVDGSQVIELSLYSTIEPTPFEPSCCRILQVTIGYTTGAPTSGTQTVNSVQNWTFFDFTSLVDPDRAVSSIELKQLTTGYLGVDDVALLVIPEPSTSLLMGLGLLLQAARGRACRPTPMRPPPVNGKRLLFLAAAGSDR